MCRRHVRQLAGLFAELQGHGVEVIILGPGDREDAQVLATSLNPPFKILADEDGHAYRDYGLSREVLGLIQQSGSFIVDRDGVLVYVRRGTSPIDAFRGKELSEWLDQNPLRA